MRDDDSTFTGPAGALDEIEAGMRDKYGLKVEGRLGPGHEDENEATVLNRVVKWCGDGLESESDRRQAENLVYELGLGGPKPVATAGTKITREQLYRENSIEEDKIKMFRASAAKGNYLTAARVDIRYAAGDMCRYTGMPKETNVGALGKTGRHIGGKLLTTPRSIRTLIGPAVSAQANPQAEVASCPGRI